MPESLGAAYDLITNAEWQTVAREVETAYSAVSYLNWSNGSNTASNYLNMGNMGLDGNLFYNLSNLLGPCRRCRYESLLRDCLGHPNCAKTRRVTGPISARFNYPTAIFFGTSPATTGPG